MFAIYYDDEDGKNNIAAHTIIFQMRFASSFSSAQPAPLYCEKYSTKKIFITSISYSSIYKIGK